MKKHKFVALTRVSDPALHNSGTAVRRNVPLAARQALLLRPPEALFCLHAGVSNVLGKKSHTGAGWK